MTQSGQQILVIHKNESIRNFIVDGLAANGYSVLQALDGKEADEFLSRAPIALVYVSLSYQNNGNLTLISEIRQRFPTTQIVAIVSQSDSAFELLEAERKGVANFLSMPCENTGELLRSAQLALVRPLAAHGQLEALTSENKKLKDYIKRLEMDQQAGRRVQSKLMPQTPARFGNVYVSYKVIPSLYLSGDFIDYGYTVDRYLAFYLTDVSGHGAASAFVTAWLKQLVTRFFTEQKIYHSHESFQRDVGHLLKLFNREVIRAQLGCHLTCFTGVIDTHTGEMRYVVAGHLPLPLLINNGRAEYLKGKGKPLGIFEDADWEVNTIQLPRYQPYSLVVFSDGILEVLPPEHLIEKEAYLKEALAIHSGDINVLCETLNITNMDTAPDDIAILKIDNMESV